MPSGSICLRSSALLPQPSDTVQVEAHELVVLLGVHRRRRLLHMRLKPHIPLFRDGDDDDLTAPLARFLVQLLREMQVDLRDRARPLLAELFPLIITQQKVLLAVADDEGGRVWRGGQRPSATMAWLSWRRKVRVLAVVEGEQELCAQGLTLAVFDDGERDAGDGGQARENDESDKEVDGGDGVGAIIGLVASDELWDDGHVED